LDTILTRKYERTSAMPKHVNGYALSPKKRKTEYTQYSANQISLNQSLAG